MSANQVGILQKSLNLIQHMVESGSAFRGFIEESVAQTPAGDKWYEVTIGDFDVGLMNREVSGSAAGMRYEVRVGAEVNTYLAPAITTYNMNMYSERVATASLRACTVSSAGALVDLDITTGGGSGGNPAGSRFDEANDYRIFKRHTKLYIHLVNPDAQTHTMLVKLKWHEFFFV